MSSNQGTIVVGVDGSEGSTRALQWAAQQATAEHRQLTLVHAINAAPAFMDAGFANTREAREELHATGRNVLEEARKEVGRLAPGLDALEVLELEDPRALLLKMSEGATMVVVGSRGLGRVRTLLLGSVSVALVRHAHCPVVVLRPGHMSTGREGIVVGLDNLPESRPVLEFAYREASLRDLPLIVLYSRWTFVAGTEEAVYLPAESDEDRESVRLALAEAVAGMAEKYPDVTVTTQLTRGLPQEALVHLSERMNLIVVGARRARGLQRILSGSVSVAVVEHASCPVAVVPVR